MKYISEITKNKIIDSFHLAELDKSNLREHERDLYGASSHKIKHVINTICSLKNYKVLELGVYRGSTLVAMNYDTNISYVGVDDFTIDYKEPKNYKKDGWNNVRLIAFDLLKKYAPKGKIIEEDITNLDVTQFTDKFDVIHYDLDEHHANFESVMRKLLSVMDTNVIIMVSNWNSVGLRNSFTRFAQTPGIVIEKLEEKLSRNTGDTQNWYNGFAVFLMTIEKS